MDSIGKEFGLLEQHQSDFQNNFESSCGLVARKMTLFHSLQYLIHVKNQMEVLAQENKQLTNQNVRGIRHEDSALNVSQGMAETMQDIIAEKRLNQQTLKITEGDIFWTILKTFRYDFIEVIILFFIDALCRLAFSVLIVYLFEAVEGQNLTVAYIYTGVLTVLWYLSQLFRQAGTIVTHLVVCQVKSGLAMLLYAKVSTLTAYSIKSSSIGKITNLLSNDLAAIQQQIAYLTSSIAFPIFLIGSGIILVVRIGWAGLAGIIIIVLMIPLTNKISEINSEIVKEVNVAKDRRVEITSQTIEGIKCVKLYGWELAFKKIILEIRQQELWSLKKLAFGKSVERALGYFISFFASLVMIVIAYYVAGIDFTKIFSVLEIMSSLKANVLMFTLGMGLYYELKVIFGRFASVFNLENVSMVHVDTLKKETVQSPQEGIKDKILSEERMHLETQPEPQNIEDLHPKQIGDISFQKFNGFWNEDVETPCLKHINKTFHSGRLYGVTGKVGSGKSSILAAILGQMPYYSGKLEVEGSIAYVEQEAVIFSDTIRNNITFGLEFHQTKYDMAVRLACLESDFKLLKQGDETMLGEKGITLSGGQKARLTLARAVYSGANIYLLDDPISAVDSRVAKQIFENCIKPLSRSKTVILTTHQISYIQECDEAMIIQNGEIVHQGAPESIKSYLEKLLKASSKEEQDEEDEDEKNSSVSSNFFEEFKSSILVRTQSNRSEGLHLPPVPELIETIASRLLQKEEKVTWNTYLNFFFSVKSNYVLLPLTFILFVVTEVIISVYYRFLAGFKDVQTGESSMFGNNFAMFWIVLALLLLSYFILLVVKYFLLNLSILHSSETIHLDMISSIVFSPCFFFDITPSGILINKFSSDLGIIDKGLMNGLVQTIEGPTYIFVAIVNICQINLYFMIPAAIFFIVSVLFFRYSRPAIIGCKQLSLQNKTPIFHFFGQSINGLTQVRVYQRKRQRIQKFSEIMNRSTKAAISFHLVSKGFGFYETVFSIVLMWVGMFLGILQSNPQNNNLYAVAIIYLITISERVRRVLKQFITVDSFMVSAERIMQLQHLESEKQLRNQYDREVGLGDEADAAAREEDLHQQWPSQGTVEMKNLSMRYKEPLPLALNNFTFKGQKGQKIGVVGRTGAGKSSIIQVLFRLYEPVAGSTFTLGSHNALKMGLHSLRQHLSVIPQMPFIFKGTIKQNLDPFGTAKEETLWGAVREAGLGPYIQSLSNQLQTDISNNSETFSVGQKQLLCLARALIRKNKFIILDEATSNVDMQTDSFIQDVIKKNFGDKTVITIAHRLNTIADYDRVIVMKRGRLAEEGSPYELLEKKSFFYRMVKMTGRNSLEIRSQARLSSKKKLED